MMNPLLGMFGLSAVNSLTSLANDVLTRESDKPSDEFETTMMGFLSNRSEEDVVNEEELYAALLAERLLTHVGQEASARYKEILGEEKAARTRPDGYIFVEDAANAAMQRMLDEGHVDEDLHAQIVKEAFYAADLDDNPSVLYDGRGGPGDPTIAIATLEVALQRAKDALERGEFPDDEELEARDAQSERIVPQGQDVDGPGGFVWKPEGDHTSKLVILLPTQLTGEVLDVVLKDEEGSEIERGRATGVANGGREHFRFDRAGSGYQENITVEVLLKDGTRKEYFIPNPALRYD